MRWIRKVRCWLFHHDYDYAKAAVYYVVYGGVIFWMCHYCGRGKMLPPSAFYKGKLLFEEPKEG